jgi:drug/metabolite transporter (DMT)-like permease
VSSSAAATSVGPQASNAFIAAHLVGCGLTWGCGFLFIKLVGDGLPLTVIAASRALLAAAALMLAVALINQSILPSGREWRDWLVLGTVNGWGPNLLVAYALLHMDSGPAALIQASGPLLTALLAHAFLAGERLTAARLVGVVVGMAGAALLIGPKAFAGGGTTLGVLAMVVLTLGYAIGNVYARTITNAVPIRMALGQQTVSAIIGLLIALVAAGPAGFAGVGGHAPALLALGLFSTALPIWIFMRLITASGPTKAAMAGYLVPVTAVTLGVLVLGEPVVPQQILGGAIVLLGVAIVTGLIRLPTWRPS